jgi:PPOX class probable F420-dependent enzyme
MELTDTQRAFLEKNRSAAMISLRRDGTAQAVRVGVALVDGRVWVSGTQTRLRTRLLRRDPRCTLFVFETGFNFLTLEGTVTILEGPDVPELSVRLFQEMQKGMEPGPKPGHLMWYGKELTLDEFRQAMVQEQRLIYELNVTRAYGSSPR